MTAIIMPGPEVMNSCAVEVFSSCILSFTDISEEFLVCSYVIIEL